MRLNFLVAMLNDVSDFVRDIICLFFDYIRMLHFSSHFWNGIFGTAFEDALSSQ